MTCKRIGVRFCLANRKKRLTTPLEITVNVPTVDARTVRCVSVFILDTQSRTEGYGRRRTDELGKIGVGPTADEVGDIHNGSPGGGFVWRLDVDRSQVPVL